MAYKDPETGRTKHKTLWVVVFWCIMVAGSTVVQAVAPEVQLPLAQIVTVAGTLSTAYVAMDKGTKIAGSLSTAKKAASDE